MNAGIRFLFALVLFGATPVFAAKPSTPVPSARLRQLIDKTMSKLATITNSKAVVDRTALSAAQGEFTAKALTAPPAQQPMYQAAQNVVAGLVAAVEEHEKAAADFHYSKNVHGAQDLQDEDISNARQHSGTAFANNAKQNKENADSRKALLDKEKFLSDGAIATWTQRVEQLHDLIEQAYVSEVVAEKQLAMLTPPAPPAAPPPKPAHKTKEPSASEQYSPVGAWKATATQQRPVIFKEDNTVTGGKFTGTWKWTDQSKGTLSVSWSDGLTMNLNFSVDGGNLSGMASRKASNGYAVNFTRDSDSAATTASGPPPAPKSVSKSNEPSAAEKNSPVGSWKTLIPGHRAPTFNADNTVVSAKRTGTWNWTDQSKGALCIVWNDGLRADLNFSPDGRAMTGTASNGKQESYTRSTEAAPDASKSPSDGSTGAPAIAEIRLKADPSKGLVVQRDKPAALSPGEGSKIRFLPGLKDSRFVSLQLDGAKGFYLRHQRGVLYLHEQPQLNTLFEEDASFKLIHLDGDKVRFESSNFPGTFITARDDGSVVVIRDPVPAQSIFVLKTE